MAMLCGVCTGTAPYSSHYTLKLILFKNIVLGPGSRWEAESHDESSETKGPPSKGGQAGFRIKDSSCPPSKGGQAGSENHPALDALTASTRTLTMLSRLLEAHVRGKPLPHPLNPIQMVGRLPDETIDLDRELAKIVRRLHTFCHRQLLANRVHQASNGSEDSLQIIGPLLHLRLPLLRIMVGLQLALQ